MPRETVHILQAYVAGRGRGLKAEPPVGCKDAAEAARKAERLATVREGVIAYSVSADVRDGRLRRQPGRALQGRANAAALGRNLTARGDWT